MQKRQLETAFALHISPTSSAVRRLDHIALQLVSLCEQELSENNNFARDPVGALIWLREMSWSQECPNVAFDGTTMANYRFSSVSPNEPDPLELTVFNPSGSLLWPGSRDGDPSVNPNLRFVRLQYRPVSGGEWITAKYEDSDPKFSYKKNLLCGGSRLAGCSFKWDVHNKYELLLSGFKDGVYELRVKNFCFGTPAAPISALADSTVH